MRDYFEITHLATPSTRDDPNPQYSRSKLDVIQRWKTLESEVYQFWKQKEDANPAKRQKLNVSKTNLL